MDPMLATVDEIATTHQPSEPTNTCCSCRCDRDVQLNMNCYWCQFEDHLDKCFAKIGR
jgi:hypothetical protein